MTALDVEQGINYILRSDDGGETWTPIGNPNPSARVEIDPESGFGWITYGGTLNSTTDGGQSWHPVDHPNFAIPSKDIAVKGNKSWFVGGYGQIVYYEEDILSTGKKTEQAEPPAKTAFDWITHLSATPNPFHPQTVIRFQLARQTQLSLKIFDVTGRLVQTLVDNRPYPAGSHSLEWNGRNLSSGIYFYQLQTPGLPKQRGKAVLLK